MLLTQKICFIFYTILVSTISVSFCLQCRNEKNQEVDWFVNYKIPKIEKGFFGTDLSKGTAYAYITSLNPGQWTLSSVSVTSNRSMMGFTLEQIFSAQKEVSYLFYNDEPPEGYNGTSSGHLKGVVAFDDESGFWLIHSIPKFSDPNTYDYPDNALSNGQSVLCITFPISQLNMICRQLLFSHPKIYKRGATENVLDQLDDIAKTIFTKKPDFVKKPPFRNSVILTSLNEEHFISFAKDNQLKEDLYKDFVSPYLNSSLIAETWRRGSGTALPPSCETEFYILDVVSLNMKVSDTNIYFKSTEDHSKWAISPESTQYWICIGDMNRMKSQRKRGGGTVCFQNKAVWKAFNSIIEETDHCPSFGNLYKNDSDIYYWK